MNFAKISTNDVRNTMAENNIRVSSQLLSKDMLHTHISLKLAHIPLYLHGYTCVIQGTHVSSDLELLITSVGSPIPLFRAYLLVISDQSEQPY